MGLGAFHIKKTMCSLLLQNRRKWFELQTKKEPFKYWTIGHSKTRQDFEWRCGNGNSIWIATAIFSSNASGFSYQVNAMEMKISIWKGRDL